MSDVFGRLRMTMSTQQQNHVEYKKKPQVIGKEAKQYIEHDLK